MYSIGSGEQRPSSKRLRGLILRAAEADTATTHLVAVGGVDGVIEVRGEMGDMKKMLLANWLVPGC